MLTVYKASAGSGKTFQLVVEYLQLIMENPQNYRHILAVTFTNKATNEMKSRILEQLHLLATGQPSDYLRHLKEKIALDENQIRNRAKLVLKNILHDYNRFSVSTIDSFTQRTIKAFNRELGISPNFMLELDNDMVLAEATDRLIANIDKDKKLRKWLISFSREKIQENQTQHLENSIKKLGAELFKEKFQLFFPAEGESVYSRKNLKSFGRELNEIKAGYENTLKSIGKRGVDIIANSALTVDDFSGKSRGVAAIFEKFAGGAQPGISDSTREAAENPEKWYTRTSPKKDEIRNIAENHLQPLLRQIIEFIDRKQKEYNTALAVLKQFRTLGILTDLKEVIKQMLHEKGLLQLSDANLLLSKIIGNSDAPFIYEKTGHRYHHFMLDEFQDTSLLQWKNFKPLVLNSLASGNKNLLVGDVKQSIYRWRNGDWNILAKNIYQDFREDQLSVHTLKNNWRSEKRIVAFNNAFFEHFKETMQFNLLEVLEGDDEKITNNFKRIYDSIEQVPAKKGAENEGYVNISFLADDDFENCSVQLLIEEVKKAQDKGIKASEMAILLRKNKEGPFIIEKFLEAAGLPENQRYNLSVLSNESLFLRSSQGALLIINILRLLTDPGEPVIRVALLHQWLNWLKPELIKKGKLQPGTTGYDFGLKENNNSWKDQFEAVFEAELADKIRKVKENIPVSSLDETVTRIASLWQLFEIESELPFIQTLTDQAGILKSSLSNDISNFLYWWDEKGSTTSVNVNEEADSIQLMTVHKAKGLEFKAVFIPFFNWETQNTGNKRPMLWVNPKTAPFNRFPVLPVQHEKLLRNSLFCDEYNEETVSTFIDVFNLVYVAFTRAKSALFVHCQELTEQKKETSSAKPVHFMLKKTLEKMVLHPDFQNCFNDEKTLFQLGEIPLPESTAGNSASVYIEKYAFTDFSDKVKLRWSGEYLADGETMRSVKNTGSVIHEILASVETANELENACRKALAEGKIDESEMNQLLVKLKAALQKEPVNSWFDGHFRVFNERSLLSPGKTLRPDRIMILGDKAVVADYKTGEVKADSHRKQVQNYAEVLKKSGFRKVEGYLWYIGLNEVDKVCEL